jgi:hypothetical protein
MWRVFEEDVMLCFSAQMHDGCVMFKLKPANLKFSFNRFGRLKTGLFFFNLIPSSLNKCRYKNNAMSELRARPRYKGSQISLSFVLLTWVR